MSTVPRLDDSDDLRRRLRDTAVSLCTAGWPVLPTYPPLFAELVSTMPPTSPAMAADWWSDQLYGLACRTGVLFDVLQVPESVARLMVVGGWPEAAPVLRVDPATWPVTGERVWWFPVTPGSPQIRDFPRTCPIRLLERDGWIPLPPTPTSADDDVNWVLPDPGARVTLSDVAPAAVLSLRSLPHSLSAQWSALKAWVRLRRADRLAQT